MTVKLLTEQHFEFVRRLQLNLSNAALLEISCHGSYYCFICAAIPSSNLQWGYCKWLTGSVFFKLKVKTRTLCNMETRNAVMDLRWGSSLKFTRTRNPSPAAGSLYCIKATFCEERNILLGFLSQKAWYLSGIAKECSCIPGNSSPFNSQPSNTYKGREYRGSYISAHVLLNLLNKLGNRDKMRGLSSILSLFRN